MNDQTQTPSIEVDSIVSSESGDLYRVLELKRGGWLSVESLETGAIGNIRANTVELSEPEPEDENNDEQEQDEIESTGGRMAQTLARYRARYPKAVKPNGKSTQDLNDQIAQLLRPLDPVEVCNIADRIFNVPTGTHALKYAHLNNGQQRMNSGNRIRAAFKKADTDEQSRILSIVKAMAAAIAEANADEQSDTEQQAAA